MFYKLYSECSLRCPKLKIKVSQERNEKQENCPELQGHQGPPQNHQRSFLMTLVFHISFSCNHHLSDEIFRHTKFTPPTVSAKQQITVGKRKVEEEEPRPNTCWQQPKLCVWSICNRLGLANIFKLFFL